MNRGVRISSLSVDAFRGISDLIRFDLSSPITLIFAPNGTGKTTLCEAAEWLLTGQVERLRDGKDFDPRVLKSKFVTEGREPSVLGSIAVGNETRWLARAAHGPQQDTTLGKVSGDLEAIGPHDLLSFLAPSAASQEAHHLRAINLRQRWLRGTRFLSAEALASLVDSDDKTIERRTEVFADLLGIRHLLDAEKICDRFIADLSSRERYLSQRIVGRESEISALNAALANTDESVTGASARSEIEAAESKLGLAANHFSPEDPTVASRIETARAEYGRRKHQADLKASDLEAVALQWPARAQVEQKVAALTLAEIELSERLSTIEISGRAAAVAVTDALTRQAQQSEQARVLMAARDTLSQHIVALSAALGDVPNGASPLVTASLASLMDALPEGRWSVAELERRRAELRAAAADVTRDADERRRVEFLVGQLDLLTPDLVSEEGFARLRTEAARLEAIALEARARADATSDPLARLQGAARDLLAHTHDNDLSRCPVCSHDWGEAASLRRAIADTLTSAPEFARLTQSAASSAVDAARIATTRVGEASAKRKQADHIEGDIAALRAAIAARGENLRRLGLTGDDPEPALRRAEWRLSIASALNGLIDDRDRFAALMVSPATPLLTNDTAISGLLERFHAAVATRDHAIQYQLASLARELEEKTAERDQLRATHASTQQQLRDCRAESNVLKLDVSRLGALWEAVAAGRAWTGEALGQVRAEIAGELRALATAASHIAAASAAWSAEVRRIRLEELSTAVAPDRERVAHMAERIAAAKRAKATFHETYNDVSKRQIEDLSRVVNPLFARMHANRVFDRIKLGQNDEPLRWLADAGSQEMDPGKDFSQGQRQDLALALFLGRARSLGGTFFLDEPVTHLDDLNRVGLLDILRATVMESSATVNLVITTASKALARHLIEKFSAIDFVETPGGRVPPLRVLELDGNGRTGVVMNNAFPA
jgi:DNA repair exonuclease SbcCD ATPase subunit